MDKRTLFPQLESEEHYFRLFKEKTLGMNAAQTITKRHEIEGPITRKVEGTNLVFRVGQKYWLKFYCPFWKDEFKAELDALKLIQNKMPFSVSEAVNYGEIENWNYLITNHLEGVPFRDVKDLLSMEEKEDLAVQLGIFVKALHQLPAKKFCRADFPSWDEFVQNRLKKIRSVYEKRKIDEFWIAQVERYLNDYEKELCKPVDLCLIHADLHEEHILLRKEGNRYILSGILDFADSMYGCHEYEFVDITLDLFYGEPQILKAFFLSYGYREEELNGVLSQKILAWALLHRFFHFNYAFKKEIKEGSAQTLVELSQRFCPLGS